MSDPALRNTAADAAATDLDTNTWYAIHDGTAEGDEVSTSRIQPTYDPASGGTAALNATLSFTGPASGSALHLGVWDASTAGNLRFTVPLSGDTAFNSNGDLNLTAAPVEVT